MSGLLILNFIIQIICSIHVIKTGRKKIWLLAIFIAPGIGSIVYFIMELLPDLAGSNTSERANISNSKKTNPDRAYRQAKENLESFESIENQLRFAEATLGIGEYDEAIARLEKCLTGQFTTDPKIRLKLVTAHFISGNMPEVLNQLNLIKEQNNGYQSQQGHLMYAQALEKMGHYNEAISYYEGQTAQSTGEELRARFAMLLMNRGQNEKAAEIFKTIIENVDRSPKHDKLEQNEWYRIAKLYS